MAKLHQIIRMRHLLFALLCAPATFAQGSSGDAVVLANAHDKFEAGRALAYFQDPERQCDLACARNRFARGDATRSKSSTPNLGFTGSWWFHLRVRNASVQTNWVANIGVPYVDDVMIHAVHPDGRTQQVRTGDGRPTAERPMFSRVLAAPLHLPAGEEVDVYLRLSSGGPITLPLSFQTERDFNHHSEMDYLMHGVYFGILVAVGLYNLLIFAILRDRTHLLYSLYIGIFGFSMLSIQGFSALYIWPENPWIINRAMPLSAVASGIAVIVFTRSFLGLPSGSPQDRMMLGILATQGVLVLVALFAPFQIAVQIVYGTSLIVVLWLLWLGIDQLLRGNRTAYYFVLAWGSLLTMLAAHILTRFGVLPSNALTENGLLAGSAAEAILLSTALAHRFALIRNQSVRLQREAADVLERRVEERTRELDHALRARSEFLATVSHEIRTPMNGVLGIAELLQDTPLNERQRDYVRVIQNSGRTLLTVINDVLDFSKIEAGKMSLEHTPFDLRSIIDASSRIFSAEAERRALRFSTHVDDSVPREVIGDPVRIQQVLTNLLANAVKFTEAGDVSLSVRREAGNKLAFTVTDTGTGIPEELQPRLFEAFAQGDSSTNRRYGGTGLGLAITKQLVELMGGSIGFRSTPAVGTTFTFTIPVRTGASGSWQQIPAESGVLARPLCLLVVDDNLVNLQVAGGMLRKLGHEVDTVESAGPAIEKLFSGHRQYDAVFMDCEMPVMDGFTATRQIRERERQERRRAMPIIALTAHAFAEKIDACRAAGMDDHLAKPLNLRQLDEVLRRATRKS
ncbi:MAG: 7TM diverse intracellular signaling domain-containing protein [Gammaproteobacteria bacterium]